MFWALVGIWLEVVLHCIALRYLKSGTNTWLYKYILDTSQVLIGFGSRADNIMKSLLGEIRWSAPGHGIGGIALLLDSLLTIDCVLTAAWIGIDLQNPQTSHAAEDKKESAKKVRLMSQMS